MIGESADPGTVAPIIHTVGEMSGIHHTNGVLTVYLSPHEILVLFSLEFSDQLHTPQIEAKVIELEQLLRLSHPDIVAVIVKPRMLLICITRDGSHFGQCRTQTEISFGNGLMGTILAIAEYSHRQEHSNALSHRSMPCSAGDWIRMEFLICFCWSVLISHESLIISPERRVFMQNGIQQRIIDVNFSVVADEPQFSKLVHEKADARASSPNHLGQRFLTHFNVDWVGNGEQSFSLRPLSQSTPRDREYLSALLPSLNRRFQP